MDIREFFSQLFNQLSTQDSWMIIGFLFVSWLLGLLSGRWSYRRKYKKLQRAFKQKESDYNVLKAESDALQQSYDLASADLKKANLEVESLTTKNKKLEEERVNLHNEMYAANERIQGLEATQHSYMSEVEGLNNEVLNLRSQNEQLTSEIEVMPSQQMVTDAQLNPATDDRLTAIEQKLESLTLENQSLQAELDKVNVSSLSNNNSSISSDLSSGSVAPIPEITERDFDEDDEDLVGNDDDFVDGIEEEMEEDIEEEMEFVDATEIMEPGRSDKARKAIDAALGSRIPRATAAERNDLKQINGIGPFIEDKLNGIGIYTYEQISKFDPEIVNLITDAIQFFPGRIERDDWVGQSKKLLGA